MQRPTPRLVSIVNDPLQRELMNTFEMLERMCSNLTYPSEGDEPIKPFSVNTDTELHSLMGTGAREFPLEDFFDIELEYLRAFLVTRLKNLKHYRVGEGPRVRVYVVGIDNQTYVGVKTISVET